MKKTLIGLAIVTTMLGACTNNKDQEVGMAAVTLSNPNGHGASEDNPMYYTGNEIMNLPQRLMVQPSDYADYQAWKNQKQQPLAQKVENTPQSKSNSNNNTVSKNNVPQNGNNSNTDVAMAPPPVQKKKGWSNKAKGAVIGGGTGAVLGAVISKNKVKGGIIGGLLGAGVGYVIGNAKDKKNGN
ncbi:MAG: YMGG-like glycine zipper-containing protein [Chitinophagaceae bacterium]